MIGEKDIDDLTADEIKVIGLHYRAGIMRRLELAKLFKTSIPVIEELAKRNDWRKVMPAADIKSKTKAKVIQQSGIVTPPAVVDPVELASAMSASIEGRHKTTVNKYTDIADKLFSGLSERVDSMGANVNLESILQSIALTGVVSNKAAKKLESLLDLSSIIDDLDKLTRTTGKLIQLERALYGLEELNQIRKSATGGVSESAVVAHIRELTIALNRKRNEGRDRSVNPEKIVTSEKHPFIEGEFKNDN